jgi:uncharacterized RDD family membrane protein YckC
MALIEPKSASLGDRALGQLVDGLVGVGVFFLVGMLLSDRFGGMTPAGFELTGLPALILLGVLLAVMLAYFVLCEALFGATLGKVVAEIQVTTREGQRIGMRASLVRNVLRLFDGIGGYLVAAFAVILTTNRVRFGDIVAGTIVIPRESARAVRAGALATALIVAIAGIVGGFALRDSTSASAIPRGGAPFTATLARSVDSAHRPTEAATIFSPEAATINVAFNITTAPPGSSLKAVWTAVDVGDAAPPNTELDETRLVVSGPAPGTFRLRRGPQPWPVGEYRVDLYLDDQLVVTLPYTVAP